MFQPEDIKRVKYFCAQFQMNMYSFIPSFFWRIEITSKGVGEQFLKKSAGVTKIGGESKYKS